MYNYVTNIASDAKNFGLFCYALVICQNFKTVLMQKALFEIRKTHRHICNIILEIIEAIT